MKRRKSIQGFIGYYCKVSQISSSFLYCIFFVINLTTSLWRSLHFKEPFIVFPPTCLLTVPCKDLFILSAPSTLQYEELIDLFICNGRDELTASGRADIGATRDFMSIVPLFKTIQGIIILKYQVIGN